MTEATVAEYDESMNTRITVSLPEHLVERAREAVRTGRAKSVSAWVAAALEQVPVHDAERASALEIMEEWLAQMPPITEEGRAWVADARAAAARAADRRPSR